MAQSKPSPYMTSELQMPEDQTLWVKDQYTAAGEIMKPPGIQTLEEWGQVRAQAGKHPGKTFAEIYDKDPCYLFQLKNRKGVSAWVRSLQMYTRARLEITNQALEKDRQMPLLPTKGQRSKKVEEGWTEVAQSSNQEVHRTKNDLKRPAEEEQSDMAVEASPERVIELQTKIAILQRELEKEINGSQVSHGPPAVNEMA